MSEYKPITGEIREQMEQAGRIYYPTTVDGMQNTQVRINLAWLTERLDAIDSIHAALEAENAALKAELDRARNEWDYWESTHVELPKDADGEYICAGDKLDGYGKTIEVVELRYGRSGWVLISRDGNAYADTYAFSHHRPDTWERIIEDAIRGDGGSYGCLEERFDATVPALVARCKALAGDAE